MMRVQVNFYKVPGPIVQVKSFYFADVVEAIQYACEMYEPDADPETVSFSPGVIQCDDYEEFTVRMNVDGEWETVVGEVSFS